MSSVLNSDEVQKCSNCEYSYYENNILYCMQKKIDVSNNLICQSYDFSNGDLNLILAYGYA